MWETGRYRQPHMDRARTRNATRTWQAMRWASALGQKRRFEPNRRLPVSPQNSGVSLRCAKRRDGPQPAPCTAAIIDSFIAGQRWWAWRTTVQLVRSRPWIVSSRSLVPPALLNDKPGRLSAAFSIVDCSWRWATGPCPVLGNLSKEDCRFLAIMNVDVQLQQYRRRKDRQDCPGHHE